MQFIEWSIIGLRSARHSFRHVTKDVTVTLFPMVHLGEQQFYDGVYADAAAHDVVVLEGVNSRIGKRLTRAYRWVGPARLGLVVQPKFPRDRAHTAHADLSGDAFDALWRKAAKTERIILESGATLMGLRNSLFATRERLGKKLNTTDKKSRDTILMWDERLAPMLTALLTARDEVLCNTVLDLTSDAATPRSIAVIYGAAHMGALRHALTGAGFHPVDSQWNLIFGP